MDKVTISNLQGENGLVNVIRYFMNNGNEYLIYSLNEVDEAGYTRLYVTKITGVDGTYSAETLNDTEWNEIKNIVKLIVKANKEGIPVPVQDLNPKKISNILLKDKKIFKLNAPLVNDLGANKPNFDEETGTQNTIPTQPAFNEPVQPTFDIPTQPAFNEPVQPTFDIPAQPAFNEPVQPTFDVPTQPAFNEPVQPTFDIPTQPAFNEPVQPTFDIPAQPTFNEPVQPTFNFNNQSINQTDNYKTMYEEVLEKNNELQEQINKLNTELIQYKEIINNVKNIIEK